ncbi:hypothetical protein FRC07_009941 [Ceratobasidium sp. 392]|nr:hypothetical protein FRC07_009941 [Ceratobasidium sp. 392]
MAHLLTPVKQEPDLTDTDHYSSDRKLQGAEQRSLSVFSGASESLNNDESDTEMSSHADGEHLHITWRSDPSSQLPPMVSDTHVDYSSSEETQSKQLPAEARHSERFRSYDTEDEDTKPPLVVKREDHPISDLADHSSSLPPSPGAPREFSSSRSSTPTPTPTSRAAPRHVARHAGLSPSHPLRLRRQELPAAFLVPRTSSRSKAAIYGVSPRNRTRPKTTSELVDDKRRIFIKQEIEVRSVYGASLERSNPQNASSRSSSATSDSRASSEENDLTSLGREFYVNLETLYSMAKSAAVSGGARSRRGAQSKPLDLCQAKLVYDQLAGIESTASRLRQILACYFSLATSDSSTDPSCQSASINPPEAQPEADISTPAQPDTTPASTEADTDMTSMLDLGSYPDPNQTSETGTLGGAWDSTQSNIPYDGPNGWDLSCSQPPFASYPLNDPNGLAPPVAPPLPTLTNPSQQGLTLPVPPLFPNIDSFSTFGTQEMHGLDGAHYYNTVGPSYPVDPMLDTTVDSPFNSVVPSLTSNTAFASNLDVSVNKTITPSEAALWQEYAARYFASLPDNQLLDTLSDNPSCSPSFAMIEAAPESNNTALVPPPAPDATADVDPPRIPCGFEGCTKTFRRPYLLRDHMRTHSGEGSGCGKRFGSQSNLTRHFKTHLKRDKAAPGGTQVGNEDGRLASPSRNSSLGPLVVQNTATPRRSRRLQNTASNPLGQRGFRILEPRTPASVNARAQKVLA